MHRIEKVYNDTMTLVFKDIPEPISRALEDQARKEHRSVEEVALDALARGLNTASTPTRDLSAVAGSLSEEDARTVEETVRWMDEGDVAARQ